MNTWSGRTVAGTHRNCGILNCILPVPQMQNVSIIYTVVEHLTVSVHS